MDDVNTFHQANIEQLRTLNEQHAKLWSTYFLNQKGEGMALIDLFWGTPCILFLRAIMEAI